MCTIQWPKSQTGRVKTSAARGNNCIPLTQRRVQSWTQTWGRHTQLSSEEAFTSHLTDWQACPLLTAETSQQWLLSQNAKSVAMLVWFLPWNHSLSGSTRCGSLALCWAYIKLLSLHFVGGGGKELCCCLLQYSKVCRAVCCRDETQHLVEDIITSHCLSRAQNTGYSKTWVTKSRRAVSRWVTQTYVSCYFKGLQNKRKKKKVQEKNGFSICVSPQSPLKLLRHWSAAAKADVICFGKLLSPVIVLELCIFTEASPHNCWWELLGSSPKQAVILATVTEDWRQCPCLPLGKGFSVMGDTTISHAIWKTSWWKQH